MPLIPTKELNTIKDNVRRLEFLEADVQATKSRHDKKFLEVGERMTVM
jgi:hypothetical protein